MELISPGHNNNLVYTCLLSAVHIQYSPTTFVYSLSRRFSGASFGLLLAQIHGAIPLRSLGSQKRHIFSGYFPELNPKA
jgi:hypothetical protein